MDVRATLLWRLSQLCNFLRDNPFHCNALPHVYYFPHRKVAWEGHEKIAVSLKADACCWLEAGCSLRLYLLSTQAWLFMNSNECYTTDFPPSSAIVYFLYWVQVSDRASVLPPGCLQLSPRLQWEWREPVQPHQLV